MKKLLWALMAVAATAFLACNTGGKSDSGNDSDSTGDGESGSKFEFSSGWKPYTYEAEGFKVMLPLQPDVESEPVATEAGVINMSMYMSVLENSGFFVGINEMPVELENDDDIYAALENGKKGAMGQFGPTGEVISERKLTLKDQPGIEFAASGTVETYEMKMKGRMFLHKGENKLFQVYTLYTSDTYNEAEADAFLDSFEFLK